MADESRAQRAEARERRRSLASKPFEEMDEAADRDRQSSPLAGAKGVVGKAAAAALTGALVGAAKAYADRRSRTNEQEQEEQPDEDQPGAEERQPEDQPTAAAEPQEEESEPQAEADAEPEPEPDEQPSDEGESPDDDDETNGARGASSGDASRIVKQAREHLNDLLGIEAESVSGLQRSNGAWHVTLEAVEVRRVPESQDVLASYDVVLDDDGGVVSVERIHRYRRAQVEAD